MQSKQAGERSGETPPNATASADCLAKRDGGAEKRERDHQPLRLHHLPGDTDINKRVTGYGER